MNLWLFGIKCVYVHKFTAVCTCAMFHVLRNRVCVGRVRGTITNMLCIFYYQELIILAVSATSFLSHHTRFLLPFSTSDILLLLCGFLGQLKLWIRLKLVLLSVADC